MSRLRQVRGFTLVELLVALTITATLAATMLVVTTGTLDLWRRSQDSFAAQNQAAVVLDYLERDFQSAIFPADGRNGLVAEIINQKSLLTNHGWIVAPAMKPQTDDGKLYLGAPHATPQGISSARFGLSGVWLRFNTTNSETNGSLPITVAYHIARRPVSGPITTTNPAAVRYMLFRSAVSSDLSFGVGPDVLTSAYRSTSVNPGAQRSATTLTNANTTSDVIATNVVDFGVWLYGRERDGELVRIYPADAGDEAHIANTAATFPQVADVMLRVLSDEGADQLAVMESGLIPRPESFSTDPEWWWAFVETHSHVIVQRVEIAASAL